MARRRANNSRPAVPVLLVCALLLLAGCAGTAGTSIQEAPYQKRVDINVGGFAETQIDPTAYAIEFSGGFDLAKERHRWYVAVYLLNRCAELTKEAGYDYFVILGADESADKDWAGKRPPPGPKELIYMDINLAKAFFRMYKGSLPAKEPNAFHADRLLTSLKPRIVRTTATP